MWTDRVRVGRGGEERKLVTCREESMIPSEPFATAVQHYMWRG